MTPEVKEFCTKTNDSLAFSKSRFWVLPAPASNKRGLLLFTLSYATTADWA